MSHFVTSWLSKPYRSLWTTFWHYSCCCSMWSKSPLQARNLCYKWLCSVVENGHVLILHIKALPVHTKLKTCIYSAGTVTWRWPLLDKSTWGFSICVWASSYERGDIGDFWPITNMDKLTLITQCKVLREQWTRGGSNRVCVCACFAQFGKRSALGENGSTYLNSQRKACKINADCR